MKLATLENTSIEIILEAFNSAFSDYLVPLQLTAQQLEDKILGDLVDLKLSPAVFEDDKVIAFILHGYNPGKPGMVYNAGTGVIPGMRGNGLTNQLYHYILPTLTAAGIKKVELEVITSNKPAIKVYESLGFETRRTFLCYKGTVNIGNPGNLEVLELKDHDWETFRSSWEAEPSWQNSISAVEALKGRTVSIGCKQDGAVTGYLVYNPSSKRIMQFSVSKHARDTKAGEALFHYIASQYSNQLSMINVDSTASYTNRFLQQVGLVNYISQYEMQWDISKR